MAATTMAQLSSIADQLIRDHPTLAFTINDTAYWSSKTSTVYYEPIRSLDTLLTLFHETSHGLCNHQTFIQDIELIKMEREAWSRAKILAKDYGITIREATIEDALDNYRDWLHKRSRCPSCDTAGIQQRTTGTYHCSLCLATWRANDARQCGLKRYTQAKTPR